MRGAIIGFGVGISLLCSCMPDLAANGAQRCTEQLECSPDAVCYRGFCLAAADVADAAVWEAGAPSGLAVGAERDAGSAAARVDAAATGVSQVTPESGAASGHNAPAADAAAESSAATPPSADPRPSADPTPSTTPDAGPAGGMGSQPGAMTSDAGHASPAEAGPAQPKDAGSTGPGPGPSPADAAAAAADAAVPPPTLRPGCTFADCCAEALRAAQDARDEDDKKDDKGSKKCGCANPALLGTVFCSLIGPWGVLP